MPNSSEEAEQVTLEISEDVENSQNSMDFRRMHHLNINTSRIVPMQPRHGLSGLNTFIREISPFVDQVNNPNMRPPNWFNRFTSNMQDTGSNMLNQPVPLIGPILHRTHINLGPNATTFALREEIQNNGRLPDDHENSQRPIPIVNVSQENNSQPLIQDSPPVNHNSDTEDDTIDPNNHTTRSDLIILLRRVIKYAPVFLILSTKFIYDHSLGLISLAAMVFTFYHANNVVKDEATKHTNRNIRRLFLAVIYTISCIFFVDFINDFDYTYLILMPTYYQLTGLWDMLWVVVIADFLLKFFTINIKILFTCLPEKVLPFKKRGKTYYFIEAFSQMYRCLMPLQPWIRYLLEAYQGYEKVVSVLLTTAYIVAKGFEIIKKANFLKTATIQLFKSSSLGSTPSEEQIDAAGKLCPICHEEYYSPVVLSCSHIFCEMCVSVWLNKVQTCPLCRAQVVTDSTWRDGTTSKYHQLY